MTYREKCYQSYVSTHWKFTHSSAKEEYEFYAKIVKKRFKNVLPKNKSAKMLDIACGAGHFLYYLQKMGYANSSGIDLSEEQLQIAKGMKINNIKKADIFEYLPKHKHGFDMIVANDIIEHFKKDETFAFLDLIYDSLKPDGQVLISTMNTQSLFGAATVFSDFTHEQGFTPESLSQVMQLCKFKDVIVSGERPVVHDFSSSIRAGIWWLTKLILKVYVIIEKGAGRGFWKYSNIFEPRIFAVAYKR